MNQLDLIFKAEFGSKLYGTDTPNSDTDYKGIFIPDARNIILGGSRHIVSNTSDKDKKNTADDIDNEFYALDKFINMGVKGETIVIDMIHTPYENNLVKQNMVWNFIHENRSKFYTTDMKAYLGYVKKQAAKYGIKGSRLSALKLVKDWVDTLPETKPVDMCFTQKRVKNVSWVDGVMYQDTLLGDFLIAAPIDTEHAFIDVIDGKKYYKVLTSAFQETLSIKRFKHNVNRMYNSYGERARLAEQNEGVDWKSLHHAVRGGLQLKEIYDTGDLKYPLKDADLLKKIKAGDIHFKEVSQLLDDVVADVESLSKQAELNGMPSKVDVAFWDDFVYNVYSNVVKGN